MMNQMGRWRNFLDSLDSDGGHIFVLIVLMTAGMVLTHFGHMDGSNIIAGAFGALLALTKSAGSNREQSGSVTSSITVDKKAD